MNASISNLAGDASLWALEFALWGILLLTEHQEASLLIVFPLSLANQLIFSSLISLVYFRESTLLVCF